MSLNAGSKGLRIQVNNNQKKGKNLSARERNCGLLAEKKNHEGQTPVYDCTKCQECYLGKESRLVSLSMIKGTRCVPN